MTFLWPLLYLLTVLSDFGAIMLIITNRNIQPENFVDGIGNEEAFGDEMNAKGPNELRFAYADKVADQWQVRLVAEDDSLAPDNLPSRQVFQHLRQSLAKDNKNCVFFVHGFNQSFAKNLEKSLNIACQHGVEVIAFSWPSNPGGFPTKEYRHAKRAARASVPALDTALEKLTTYLHQPFDKKALMRCQTRFSLMTYSLGNYLFQQYVQDAVYENETALFDNVILCQADVDNEGHSAWVERIQTGKRLYVTINEDDYVLKWSDINFQKSRLGRTARHLLADNAHYIDLTDAPGVGNAHEVFDGARGQSVNAFFKAILNGKRGEEMPGIKYHSLSNSWRF